MAIYMWREYNGLCFTANSANSTIQLTFSQGTAPISIEYSYDLNNWSDLSIGNPGQSVGIITLNNVGDKVYIRNKSDTPTSFSTSTSYYYKFVMTGSIAASGDINYLLCKDSTNSAVGTYCFMNLFNGQTSLTTAPNLPATTLTNYCYYQMFRGCENLENLPTLPATTLAANCYREMFRGCTKIKLSETQTGEYQTSYRIPAIGTGTDATDTMNNMFAYTGGTRTGTPTINTTYYTSNTVI